MTGLVRVLGKLMSALAAAQIWAIQSLLRGMTELLVEAGASRTQH